MRVNEVAISDDPFVSPSSNVSAARPAKNIYSVHLTTALLTRCAMSMHHDQPASVVKKHKKHRKEKNLNSDSKKRKRSEHHDPSTSSPTKKHQLKYPAQGSTTATTPVQPLESADKSPLFQQTSSLYLPLSPIALRDPLQGLCAEHLSPLILNYYPPLNGVILSYTNVKLSERVPNDGDPRDNLGLARSIDEYAVSYVWVTADFLLFRPQRGCTIEGWINLQNEGNLGLVCWNYFNASIERQRLPKEWRWIPGGAGGAHRPRSQKLKRPAMDSDTDMEGEDEDEEEAPYVNGVSDEEGHFVDANGKKVEGTLQFMVTDMETSRSADRDQGFLSIHGTLLSDKEEKELREQEFEAAQGKTVRRSSVNRAQHHVMSGALVAGDDENDDEIGSSPRKKHRMAY